MKKALLADRVFNRPLLVAAAKANVIAPFLAHEILGEGVTINLHDTSPLGDAAEKHAGSLGKSGQYKVDRTLDQLLPRTSNGVGLIGIEGTLINKGGWIGSQSGETSYQGLNAQIAEARADDVAAVVFEVDSYGGEVAGCDDCAAAIAELSAEKPTIAICTDHAYSAAYWLASQCRQIILPASGGVGSIGVITMHVDYSGLLKKEGVVVTVMAAGEHKADGHPYASIPDSVREAWLAEIEIIRLQFSESVSNGRGDRLDTDAALATEARTFPGELAVDAGLADCVGRPSEAFTEFVNQF